MKNMSLENIAKACGGALFAPHPDLEIKGLVIDSRLLQAGNLFIATRGAKVDGHSFIPNVAENGAAAVICEEEPAVEIPYILVSDSLKALCDIAAFYRQQLSLKVVAVTGSVGKTTTKDFIAAVLASHYQVLKTAGNFNNEIGLPLTVLNIRDEHQVAVLEMGVSDFGEMRHLAEIARPDVAVYTNISDSHLESLGDRSGVFKAKTEMLEFLAADGDVVINGDDGMLANLEMFKGKLPLRFGLGSTNDISADGIEDFGLEGTAAQIKIQKTGASFPIHLSLPGGHMIYNALAAIAVGSLFGLNEKEIQDGLNNIESVAGRSNIISLERGTLIDDCYNANPSSMKAALMLLKNVKGRKVAVLGDMFELGDEEEEAHLRIGRVAVTLGINALVCIGEKSKLMYEAAKAVEEATSEIHYFSDKNSFVAAMKDILHEGDTVLLKASHGMAFETLVEELKQYYE
jgi:UDP-N-acetylmuramoyl-tripeptide--D-alanyl-D-alanine ligase